MKKSDLRAKYKFKRLEISISELEKRSESICNILFSNFQLEGKIVSLFLPIERQKEINTYRILEKGMAIGAQIVLPKMNEDGLSLKHYRYEDKKQLILNKYGIPEPLQGKLVHPSQFDVVFVPLLTIDQNGHRVGYGKGFYDRFLNKCRPNCLFIGLYLFNNFETIDDINQHDVCLNYCITPEKIIRFEKK